MFSINRLHFMQIGHRGSLGYSLPQSAIVIRGWIPSSVCLGPQRQESITRVLFSTQQNSNLLLLEADGASQRMAHQDSNNGNRQ